MSFKILILSFLFISVQGAAPTTYKECVNLAAAEKKDKENIKVATINSSEEAQEKAGKLNDATGNNKKLDQKEGNAADATGNNKNQDQNSAQTPSENTVTLGIVDKCAKEFCQDFINNCKKGINLFQETEQCPKEAQRILIQNEKISCGAINIFNKAMFIVLTLF